MGNKRRIIIQLAVATVLCLMLAANSPAIDLVWRDDFLCYDTTGVDPGTNSWNDATIDSAGRISQIGYSNIPTGPLTGESIYLFNRFDKYGNQSQPVTLFLPDTTHVDSLWAVGSRMHVHTNKAGISVVTGKERLHPGFVDLGNYLSRIIGIVYDADGQPIHSLRCFDCDTILCCDQNPYISDGDLNNNDIFAAIWKSYLPPDSLWVRLYDINADTLGRLLNVMELPKEIEHNQITKTPAIGLADDGSFAIAWIGRSAYWELPFYAVYNADLTPRTDANIVGCPDQIPICGDMHVTWLELTIEPDGDFYIVWDALDGWAPSCYNMIQVYMRGFNANGTPKYNPVQLNDTDSLFLCDGKYTRPSISVDDYGNVLVVWADARDYPGWHSASSTPRNVYAQKVDPNGNLVGPNYRINNNDGKVDSWGQETECSINNDGQAMILWRNDWYEGAVDRVQAQLMPYHDIGTFVPGDVNLNREGNISDMTMLLEWMFRGGDTLFTFWPEDLIDINGDGISANISDITYFVDYLFGIPLGPPPFTPDEGIRQPPPHLVGDGLRSSSATAPETDTPDSRLNDLDQRLDNDRTLDGRLDDTPDTAPRDHINIPPRPPDLEQPTER
ncbi:MAG: hypothetical protein KAT79_03310 [candidate division Zixibacteria bacterium]|nr:hypothetical protein [candidate division Zixibacteria bacterium]